MVPRIQLSDEYVMRQLTYDVTDHTTVRWLEITMTARTVVMVRTIDPHGRPAETFYPRLPSDDMPPWIAEAVRAAETSHETLDTVLIAA